MRFYIISALLLTACCMPSLVHAQTLTTSNAQKSQGQRQTWRPVFYEPETQEQRDERLRKKELQDAIEQHEIEQALQRKRNEEIRQARLRQAARAEKQRILEEEQKALAEKQRLKEAQEKAQAQKKALEEERARLQKIKAAVSQQKERESARQESIKQARQRQAQLKQTIITEKLKLKRAAKARALEKQRQEKIASIASHTKTTPKKISPPKPLPVKHAAITQVPKEPPEDNKNQDKDKDKKYKPAQEQKPVDKKPIVSSPFDPDEQQIPIEISADQLNHDEENSIISASGDVEFTQYDRSLSADQMRYNIAKDVVMASGSIKLHDNGDTHTAQAAALKNQLKEGVIQDLRSDLADGSHFLARRGTQEEDKVIMEDVAYTPCDLCESDPDKSPVWAIKADKVTHHKSDKRIEYEGAHFELFGLPLLYTPYLSHTDGSVDRESGFIAPALGFKSDMGAFIGPQYYWDIAPDQDVTLGLLAFSEETPLAFGEWRQRWNKASAQLNGSITRSKRTREEDGEDITLEAELRGHLKGNALWDINEKWRSGINVAWASDDQFMRQYNINDLKVSNEDVLENEIYAERFSGRNYAVGRLLSFQDVRVNNFQDQPEVLPEIIASFKGAPNNIPIIGGNWEIDTSFLGLSRSGSESGQDVNRLSLQAAWQRHMVSDMGLSTQIKASTRYDTYNTRDSDIATAGSGYNTSSTESRAYSNISAELSYPVSKQLKSGQIQIEPIVAVSFSPDIEANNDIPNEDSQDVQIDSSNLFNANRFPGLDRAEDQSKVTYGMQVGLYRDNGAQIDAFLGQSYNFDNDENPFPEGSGLNRQSSDVVGRLSALYGKHYGLDYRFQLDNRQLNSQRHEVSSNLNLDKIKLSNQYLFARGLEGTDLSDSREQFKMDLSYKFIDQWQFNSGITQDLGEESGLRQAYAGLDYLGQCITLSLTGQRNLTDDSTGDSNTEIFFRIGLKNLTEIEQ